MAFHCRRNGIPDAGPGRNRVTYNIGGLLFSLQFIHLSRYRRIKAARFYETSEWMRFKFWLCVDSTRVKENVRKIIIGLIDSMEWYFLTENIIRKSVVSNRRLDAPVVRIILTVNRQRRWQALSACHYIKIQIENFHFSLEYFSLLFKSPVYLLTVVLSSRTRRCLVYSSAP